MNNKAIIIAGGYKPKLSVIKKLIAKGYSTIIAADGAANYCFNLNIIPNFIVGDLDSIDPKILKFFLNKSRIIKISRQNDTDLEKCIKFSTKNKFKDIILLSAIGSRLDHSICNLNLLLKYSNKINVKIIHENSVLYVIKGKNKLICKPNQIVSIYAFDNKTKITSTGLKYPIINQSLSFGTKDSTSNLTLKDNFEIISKNGYCFLITELKSFFQFD